MYKVKESELIGDIEGFPIEVVQCMMHYQYEQGVIPSIAVFQKTSQANFKKNGFDWEKTREGRSFWYAVIIHRDFNKFFAKYPKKTDKVFEEQPANSDNKEIMSKILWDNKRLGILKKGIMDRLCHDKNIPAIWIVEYDNLVRNK